MAEALSPTPFQDVQVFVTTDAFRVKRRAFNALILTDDVGLAGGVRRLYTDLSTIGLDFGTESPTYEAASQFFEQENPKPVQVWIVGVEYTAGDAPTSFSETLSSLKENYGMFFYHVAAVTRRPEDRREIGQWVAAEEAIYHTANYPGKRASFTAQGANEVQVVTVSNATGGTFTLTFDGQTTSAIPYNASASAVQDALLALSAIGPDDVAVTGNDGGPWTVTFQGDLGNQDVPEMTADGTNLVGGTVSVSTTVNGSTGVKVEYRHYGTVGNASSIQFVASGANTPLSVTKVYDSNTGGWTLLVNLATDANGASISTINDVVTAINTTLSVAQLFRAIGSGSQIVVDNAKEQLAGGGEGEETLQELYTERASFNSTRVKFYYNPDPQKYWPEFVALGQSAPRSPGSYWLRWMRVLGLPDVTDKTVFGTKALKKSQLAELRTNFINTTYTTETEQIVWSDDYDTSGNFNDVQQKVDRITIDMREELVDLFSNPPAIYVGGIPYDQEGIDLVVSRVEKTLVRNAQRDRRIVARNEGKTLARVIAPTFREMAGTSDHKNRIYRLEWEATILLFIGELRVRGFLTVQFVEPSLRIEQ